ncbi:MAG TPA: hypothetical protein VFL95_00805 [Gemmatimonadales bacterium]|nr:hypothetical protein [Gemmatimonadales bacterium]
MRTLTLGLATALFGGVAVLAACFPSSSNPGYEPYPGTVRGSYDNGVAPPQIQACRSLVSEQYNVSTNYVSTQADGVDGTGNAVIRWTLQNGPNGSCTVSPQNRVVRFDSSDNNNNLPGNSGQVNPPSNYPPPPAGVLGQPTSETANHFQIDACTMEVVRQYNINSSSIRTDQGVTYTDGNAVVRWSTDRGDNGTCVVNQKAQVMRIDRQ